MFFGAAIWPFQWSPPYEQGIKRIAGLGFKGVELIGWTRDILDNYYTPAKIAELRTVMAGEGIKLTEFVSSPPGVADRDPALRASAVDHFKRTVEVAKALGTDMVNSVIATPFGLDMPRSLEMPQSQELSPTIPVGLDWDAGYAWYVDSLQKCCAHAEANGVRWALESHPHRWATTGTSILRLLEKVGSPALGVNVDPSHLFPCGDIPQVTILQLGKKVFHTHFSDNDGSTNAHWRPGKGKIDWTAVLLALKEVGYDDVISIELEDVPGRSNRVDPTALDVFDYENTESVFYVRRCAERAGIKID